MLSFNININKIFLKIKMEFKNSQFFYIITHIILFYKCKYKQDLFWGITS